MKALWYSLIQKTFCKRLLPHVEHCPCFLGTQLGTVKPLLSWNSHFSWGEAKSKQTGLLNKQET